MPNEPFDPYNRKRTMEKLLEKIKNSSSMNETNKKSILKFYEQSYAEGLSVARMNKYLYSLSLLSKMLDKNFDKATKDDIIKLVSKIEKNDKWSDWTKGSYKIILKKFYKWLRQTDEYPKEVRWIKTTIKNNNHISPSDILTEEEIFKMVKVADSSRDKAIILVLYESGCRIGEIMNLKIKDIQFDNDGIWFMVDGKTGQRRIRLVKGYGSTEALKIWLDTHPFKDNPDANVWLCLATNNRFGRMGYGSFYKMLNQVGIKAGIKKSVNPHAFRHARATFIANGILNEWQMKEMFGWTQSSKMASVYVHLSGRDIDKALVERFGKVENSQKKTELENKLKSNPEIIKLIVDILEKKGVI